MASSAPRSAAGGVENASARSKPLGLLANVLKRRQIIVQFFAMTGILLLSCRSLGQKFRIHELTEDLAALKEEEESLSSRITHIKQSLIDEAAHEPTGAFTARLRLIFSDDCD